MLERLVGQFNLESLHRETLKSFWGKQLTTIVRQIWSNFCLLLQALPAAARRAAPASVSRASESYSYQSTQFFETPRVNTQA